MLYTEEAPTGRSWAGGTENLTCSNGVTVLKNAAPARVAAMLGVPSLVGAHVRVVHSPDSQSRSHVESLRTANERELLVHYTMESPQMWPADLDAAYMASFDLRWSYNTRLSSAPSVYHDGGKLARRVRRPVHRVGWRSKVKGRLLTTAVSNCEDFVGRAEYVRALQREMGGEFLNVGRCSGSELSAEQQAEIQSKKRGGFDRFVARGYFYLALENANCEGYITEKLGRALVAGVVPVVFDARLPSGGPRRPDYSTLLPPGSYVNVADCVARRAAHLSRGCGQPDGLHGPRAGRTASTPARCCSAPPPARPSRDARTPPSHYQSRPSRRSCMRAGRSTSQAPRRTRRSAPSAAWQRRRSKRSEPRGRAARAHRDSRRTARACRRASCVATCRPAPARPPRSRRGP